MKFLKITLLAIILLVVPSLALGVSFPSAPVPAARFATGFTYDYYGGYLSYGKNTFFEKQDLPVTMHGISAFFTCKYQ